MQNQGSCVAWEKKNPALIYVLSISPLKLFQNIRMTSRTHRVPVQAWLYAVGDNFITLNKGNNLLQNCTSTHAILTDYYFIFCLLRTLQEAGHSLPNTLIILVQEPSSKPVNCPQ